MSYNNIGLGTARGSGTNGYVTRNMSSISNRKSKKWHTGSLVSSPIDTTPTHILPHLKKRHIELEVMKYRVSLEDRLSNEDIESKVSEYRAMITTQGTFSQSDKPNDIIEPSIFGLSQLNSEVSNGDHSDESLKFSDGTPAKNISWLDRGTESNPISRNKRYKGSKSHSQKPQFELIDEETIKGDYTHRSLEESKPNIYDNDRFRRWDEFRDA